MALGCRARTRRAGLCRAARCHDRRHRPRLADDARRAAQCAWHRRQEARALWRGAAADRQDAVGAIAGAVARMERSEIRDSLSVSSKSRITLRSIRATNMEEADVAPPPLMP